MRSPYLQLSERPKELQQQIDRAFSAACHNTWLYQGDDKTYDFFINQWALLRTIILQDYPERKEFWLLDLGAGNGAVNATIAKLCNQDSSVPNDIVVNI